MKILTIIIIIVLFFVAIVTYFRYRLKHHDECITAFTGGLGSGKTFLSVVEVKKRYRKFKRQEKIKNYFINLIEKLKYTLISPFIYLDMV